MKTYYYMSPVSESVLQLTILNASSCYNVANKSKSLYSPPVSLLQAVYVRRENKSG